MNLLELLVKVGMDDKASEPISKTSKTIQDKLATAAKVGTAAMAAVKDRTVALATALMDTVNAVSEYGDTVDKTSQKLGVSAEAYQKWDYVMNISGTSMQNMTMGMKTLTNKLDDAKNGSSDAQEMFAKLGLSMEDLNSMSREDAFEAVIRGFQGMEESTERAALANDLFGRSGQELTPLFNTSIEETQELMDNAERLGIVMGEDNVKAAAAFKDAQTTLQKTMDGLRNSIVSKFLPAFTTVSQGMTELLAGNMDKGKELIMEGVSSAIEVFSSSLPSFMQSGAELIGSLLEVIMENMPAVIKAFGAGVSSLIDYIANHTDEMLNAALEFFTTMLTSFLDMSPQVIGSLITLVANLIKSVISNAPNMLKAGGELLMSLVKAILLNIANAGSAISDLLVFVLETAAGFIGGFFSSGAELIGSVIDGIGSLIGGVADTVGNGISDAVDAVGSFVGEMWSAGWNVVQGIIDGIWSNIGNVASTILSGFRGAVDTVKSFLGIASPSKLFAEIGKNTMLGMVEGIEDNMDKAENAMRSAAEDIYGAASGTVSIGAYTGILGASNGLYGVPGVNIYGDITIMADNPDEFMDWLTATARQARRQYA